MLLPLKTTRQYIFEEALALRRSAFEFANSRNSCIWTLFFTMVDYDKFTIHPEIACLLRYMKMKSFIEEEHDWYCITSCKLDY